MKRHRLDFYQRLTPELLLLLLPLAIFAFASCAIAQPSTASLLLIMAKGVAFITGTALVGALLPAYALLLLSLRQPLITISADGLDVARFYLRWQDIKCVHLQRYWGRPRVFIILNDPGAFLAALPRYASRFLRERLRATGGMLVPSVRGYSDAELSALLEQLRIERNDHQQTTADQDHVTYRRWAPSDLAAASAAATFGAFFVPRWFPLMDCVKFANVSCLLTDLKWAAILGVGAYVLIFVTLRCTGRLFPRFDVLEQLATVQNSVLGRK
jgi:hypothetical protein